jgi:hypothetical protein
MYGWIWRHLPGTAGTRAMVAAVLTIVVAVILWYLVFPWAEQKVQFDHGVVDGGTSAPVTPRR